MPADDRTYITVHDGLPDHPKIEGLSDAAFRTLITAWCWCSKHLTDGLIPHHSWAQRGPARARKELEKCGLALVTDAGIRMHDYLEHQRSAAEVEELRRKRSEAGKLGGKASARVRANAKQVLEQVPEQSSSKTQPESETDRTKQSLVLSDARKRASGTRIPEDWKPDAALIEWQRGEGIPDDFARRELPKFIDFWKGKSGKDATKADWPATWRNWLRRAVEESGRPKPFDGSLPSRPKTFIA